ncbi:hypothetical protein [Citrobacter freundii]|uniref:hypothetical protein n=1 Tax=Citrobacter freundii TaxID=546 RepID=UPI00293878A9|nr:hypothetical protein [Citrobacter freundii]ELQ7794670.1 hypothetical protein [Citrobacter freundii]MEA8857486.1 hypothetical protein [Citrobacter freundii]MEB1001322.1 hypothetical protein [Citrobacter freundii]
MEKNIISLIYLCLLVFLSYIFIKKRHYELDHKSLLKQPIFWVAIGVPFATCIFLGGLIWIDKWHSFSLTSHGYSRFLEISKLPLLVLASAVPFASIVNNLHRTIQTEKQITESEKKNKTDGYYAHAKFQTDYLKSLPETQLKANILQNTGKMSEDSKTFKITYPLSLYKKLYPNCSPISGAEYDADKNHTALILKSWVIINATLNELHKNTNEIVHNKLDDMSILLKLWFQLEMEAINICNHLEITYPTYQRSFMVQYGDSTLITTVSSLKEMYKILEALEDISVGIVDAVNQFTMVGTQVFTKTKRLFSVWARPTELRELSSDFKTTQVTSPDSPLLILNGKRYRYFGDTMAAER